MAAPKLRFKEFDGDWTRYKIAEVTEYLVDGTHFSPKTTEGEFKYITSKNIRNDGLDLTNISYISKDEHETIYKRCKVQLGDILLTKDGANTGNCCLNTLDEEFSLLSSVAVLRGKKDSFNNNFILQILQSDLGQNTIISSMSGQAITRITLAKLKDYSFFFPELTEQTQITSFLSAVDEKISQLMQKHQLLSQYKQGMMQKLFSQQIRFKADDGSEFGEWENTVLGDIADIVGGGTPSTNNEEYWSGDVVWLTPSEINQKFIGESKRTISELGVQKSSAKKLPIGTILFTSRATIGEVAIAIAEVTTNQGFQSFISNEKTFNEFLYYWIVNNKKSFIERASGSTFLEISKSKIQPMEISLPCLEEQTKIANFLSAIDQKIEVVAQQIEQAKTWKKGLLQQMFV